MKISSGRATQWKISQEGAAGPLKLLTLLKTKLSNFPTLLKKGCLVLSPCLSRMIVYCSRCCNLFHRSFFFVSLGTIPGPCPSISVEVTARMLKGLLQRQRNWSLVQTDLICPLNWSPRKWVVFSNWPLSYKYIRLRKEHNPLHFYSNCYHFRKPF